MLTKRSLGISITLALSAAVATAACGGNGSTGGNTGGQGGGNTTGSMNTTSSTGNTTTNSTSTGSNATTTSTGSGTPGGGIFQAAEPWNTPVDGVAKDPESDKIITWLSSHGGWGSGDFRTDFSLGIQYADAGTPMKPFVQSGDFYSPDCDDIPAFPVPPGGAIEGENGYACTMDGDCHLLVVHTGQNKLYEMWRAFAPPSGSTFNGGCVAVWDLLKAYPPNLRGDGCTSADAGGFPISAMLFTADEVAAGHIDHAARFILPNSRIRAGTYVHPGSHTTFATSGGADAPPYGVHFRLKASFDLTSLPSDGARVMAKALQKYGMFLADGGNIPLTAADDRFTKTKWADVNVDSHSLSSLQVTDFEVVNLGALMTNTDCVRNP